VARVLKRLSVVVLVVVATGGLGEALPVTKKPVVRKSSKQSPVKSGRAVAALSSGVLLSELGPLKGTPDNVRKQLTEKWGYPSWWPAPAGRIITVSENWAGNISTGGSRTKLLKLFLDSGQSVEQLADQLNPSGGLTRKAGYVRQSGEQDIPFERDGRIGLLVSLLVTNKSVVDGKFQVTYVLSDSWGPGQEPPVFALPSASLAKFSSVPSGASVAEASFQLSVHRGIANTDGSTTELDTPDAPVYAAFVTFDNAPAGFLDQVRKSPFPGFQLDANTTGNANYVSFTNRAARETYDVGQLAKQRFVTSVFHTFLSGEILPG
jgi:hypothetical protein